MTEMMRTQLELTQKFLEGQKNLYLQYNSMIQTSFNESTTSGPKEVSVRKNIFSNHATSTFSFQRVLYPRRHRNKSLEKLASETEQDLKIQNLGPERAKTSTKDAVTTDDAEEEILTVTEIEYESDFETEQEE